MTILIFDPAGGASGDMVLSSLVDLGCPVQYLNDILSRLDLKEEHGADIMTASRVLDNGISAATISFAIEDSSSPERSYADIREIISASGIPESVKDRSLDIFSILARAEAAVHGCPPDEVHFHEIGAADSILDITGIAAAVEWFSPEACYCGPLPLGRGVVKTRHGVVPVPAPATVKVLEGMKVRQTQIETELTTPTGAAAMKALCPGGEPPSDLVLQASGCGAGTKRIPSWPNVFRTLLFEIPLKQAEVMYIIEADIDDMIPEDWESAMESLYQAGALDVNLTQRIMKRGRPGVGIKAAAPASSLERVLEAMLARTSTIGVRYYRVERRILERREYTVILEQGPISVKESILPDGTRRIKPEFRDIYALSKKSGVCMDELRREAVLRAREKNGC
ncbi:MAG TPA: nickel pincer cofactor biosynthesis protein LarC [Spirochaetota bacterium]|nr:nickel pincer cofactor biosynthesis protein LarC [Spirochaetota bacterium]